MVLLTSIPQWDVINLLKKGLRSRGAGGPELPHASAEAAFVPLQVELSQPEEWSGAVPTWSHQLSLALQLPLQELVEMLLKGNGQLSVCLRSTDLLCSQCALSDEAGSNVHPVCSVPLYPNTVCSVSGAKSTLSGVPLTKRASLLVSRGFIYMFFSLIRKENIKK